MKLETKTIVITGAASGVGRALALRFADEHPKGLVLADLPGQAAALEALATGGGRPGARALGAQLAANCAGSSPNSCARRFRAGARWSMRRAR